MHDPQCGKKSQGVCTTLIGEVVVHTLKRMDGLICLLRNEALDPQWIWLIEELGVLSGFG